MRSRVLSKDRGVNCFQDTPPQGYTCMLMFPGHISTSVHLHAHVSGTPLHKRALACSCFQDTPPHATLACSCFQATSPQAYTCVLTVWV
eukprot:365885-Chlamydomonas_euryale.AAC.6